MKRLYDAICKNANCTDYNIDIEVLKKTTEDFPLCKSCGSQLVHTYTKTASFEISGGGVYKSGISHSI